MTPTERFWSRVDKTGECWLWTGPLHTLGYARFSVGGRRVYVHRYSYELARGPIPDDREIDHLCRVRHCVKPDHLEVVTHRVNVMRSPEQVTSVNARKTHCLRGHRFSGRDKRGWRVCNQCIEIRRKVTA